MNKIIKFVGAYLFLLLTIFILSTCSNPFTAGLGDKVDLEDPQLEITSHHNGDAVGSTFDLAGSVKDDGLIESVTISLNTEGNVIGSATINDSSWSYNYNSTVLTDGDYEFLVVAKDNTDKAVSRKVLLTVDNNPPTVLVTVPASYGIGEEFNKLIAIKGEAADTTRVKEVFVSLYYTNGTLADTNDDTVVFSDEPATGTSSWYYIFNSAILDAGSPLIGDYYFYVRAEDFSGNSNSYFYHFSDVFDLAVDKANLPNIEEINNADFGGVPITAGVLGDNLSTIRHTVDLPDQMEITIDPNSDRPEFLLISPASSADPGANVFASPQRFSGFVTDDDPGGIDTSTLTITIFQIDNLVGQIYSATAFTDEPIVDITSTQWSFSTNLPDGEYYLSLYAEDYNGAVSLPMGNPTDAQPATFRVSSFAPVVTITEPNQGSYIGSGSYTTISVSVTGMGVGIVELDPNGDGDYSDVITMTDLPILGDDIYTVDITDGVDGFNVLNGEQTLNIRAGTSGNYGAASLQYTGDISIPTSSLTYPGEGQNVNDSINFSGTTSDDKLIANVFIWIGTAAAWTALPADTDNLSDYLADPDWVEPSGTYNWSITNFDTTALTNNTNHTIGVKSFDAAGNGSDLSTPASSLNFMVNQASDKPVITANSITLAGPNALGEDPAILFTVEDDDGVDVDMIQSSMDNGTTWVDLNPILATSDTVLVQAKTTLTGILQGNHTIRFRALDINSGADWVVYGNGTNYTWVETADYPLTVDYGPPSVTLTAPLASAVMSSNFTVTGEAVDFNGVSAITIEMQGSTYTKTYLSGTDFIITPTADSTPVTFSFTIPIETDPGYSDGDYNLQIRATDNSGTVGTLNIPVGIDKTAPTALFNQPAEASTVNGTITIRGEVDDNRQVTNTYLWHGLLAATPPALTDPSWTSLGSSLVWSYILDTSPVAPTAAYKIVVITEDVSGNQSAYQILNLTVDQTTDRPEIELTNLIEGAIDNALGRNARITGNISDDNDGVGVYDDGGVDSSGIQIQIDGGGWVDVSDPPTNSGTLVSWFHDISLLSQGPHTSQVRARDINTNDENNATDDNLVYADPTNYGWITGPLVDFYIDYGPPSLTIDSPLNGSVENLNFTISGTATDANSVTNVEISFDGGVWNPVTTSDAYANWNYSYTVPGAGTSEQVVAYQVRASDNSLAETTLDRQVVIDVKAPTITGISQPGSSQIVNGTIDISGQSTDGYNLISVYYYVGPEYDSGVVESPAFNPVAPDANWTLLSGSYAWSATGVNGIDTSALADGNYTLYIVGVDSGLNYTDPNNIGDSSPRRNFTIDQVSDRPDIYLSTISTIGTASYNILPPALQLSGIIEDDDEVENSSVQIRIDSNNNGDFLDGGLENWTNISNQPGLDSNQVTWSHIFTGLTDGQYSLQMRAADNNYTGDYATTGTFSWDFLRRIDDDTIATVPFSIDLNNPVGAITYPDQGSYHNSNFTINGTASDASGIKSIEIKFGTDAPIALTPIDIDGVNYTWSYNYTLIPDGQVTYQLIVTDNYDKIFTTDRYFTIDTTGPTIGFFQPSDGDTANGSLLLRGDATDTRLVNQVYVHISDDNAAVTGDPTNGDWTGWQLADGTFSWSHRIDTTAFADGPYDAHVRAVDGAGNISGDNILNINFDQTDNSPIFSQLNLTDSPSVNLFGTGGLITGTITDDDSVDASTIEIRFDINNDADFNDGGFENWASVTNQGTSGVNVSFSHDLDAAGLPESANEYPMQIRASDIGEAAYGIPSVMTTSSTFIAAVDRSNPSVSLTSISLLDRYTLLPRSISGVSMPGALLNNNFTLKSTISDPGGIASVLVSINGGSFVNTNITDIGDGTWDYAKSVDLATNTNDGNTTITVKAIDTWGRESTQSLTIVIDSTEPTVNYVEPANNSNVNGTVTVRGTTIDNGAIQSLSISGSALSPISFTNTGTDDSWFTTFDAYTYDNVTYSIGQGDGTWLFPITVTAVDSALNKTESIRNVYLDPDGDKPVIVDATLIPGDDSSVSGTIVLQSTVTDDDTPAYVRIFADLNDDGIITPSAYPIDLSDPANGDTLDPFEEEDNYLEVSISNGVWTALVNENSEFSKANLAARAVPSPTGYIQFHIVPYDSNGTQGNTSIRRVYIDATAPVIEGVNYSSGALVKGSITITGTIKDDVALNTDYIQISFNGGLNYQNLNINSGPTTVGDYQEYTFSETIDTDSAGFFPGSSGVLYTVIKVTDNTFKQSSLNLNFNVDNELPAVLFDSDPASLSFVIGSDPKIYTFDGNASISGSNFQVMGRSSDAGTVSGIDKINIYFVKDGNFESPKSAVAPAVAINSVLGDELYDQSGIVTSGVPFTENTNYLITIDNRLEQGQFDTVVGIGDQDGFEEELNTFNDWSAFFDTTVFPDGPLDIYYVVYDNSGNKTYASVKGQISNNPPSIDSIDVGGSNYTAEPMYQKVSGISLPIALNVSDAEGIDITGYKLTIANEYTIGGDGYPGTANVFTPVVFVDTDFITTTATEGTIAIDTTTLNDLWYHVIGETMDTHGNIVTMGFYLLADNNDLTGPVATIDPFTQSHEGGSGHIEEAENSPDADNQADLSGTVTITGTVRDDNSVTSLTLAISQGSFSDIGTAALTAASDGDPLNGEEYTWTYTWDTSTIAGVADEDVIIRATGNDGVNDSISPATLTVDIVPYITDILTGNDSGLRAYVKRSALGRYTISAESTVTIVGYNLAENTANSINIGGTLLNPTGSTGTTEQIVDLGIITTPGTLTVTTNGVSSRNNTNTNNLSQNMEASIYYPDHTDDRIISLWQITPHSDVTYQGLSDAVMEPNANRDGFDWMYVRNGKELWWYKGLSDATSKITEGNALKGGDFNFNTNGSLMFLFNHDNQWTSYADDYRFIGSVQWGAIPSSLTYYFNYQDDGTTYDGPRDESYNWNNNGKNASVPRVFPRLGLGNLSFLNNPTFGGGAAYYPAYNQLSLGRYKNLKMKTIGSNTINRNYVAYFDTGAGESRSIVFYGFKAGSGTGAAEVTTANTYYHITGTSANRIPLGHDWFATVDKYHTSAADATVALAGTQASNDTGLATPRGRMDVTGINSGANSEYFDLGVYEVNATTHYGYIAYYDEVSSSLKIISNTGLYTADPLNTGWTWSTPTTIDTNAGAHVAMVIDPDGGIHLAYQDTQKNYLKYSYLTFNGTSFTIVKTVYVDALIGAGQHNSISIKDFDIGNDDYRPVITTYSSAFTGTPVSLRMAYPNNSLAGILSGANENTGAFTGDWEVIAIPAGTNPQAGQNFTETDGNGASLGKIHLGYNGSHLEEITYLDLN